MLAIDHDLTMKYDQEYFIDSFFKFSGEINRIFKQNYLKFTSIISSLKTVKAILCNSMPDYDLTMKHGQPLDVI